MWNKNFKMKLQVLMEKNYQEIKRGNLIWN